MAASAASDVGGEGTPQYGHHLLRSFDTLVHHRNLRFTRALRCNGNSITLMTVAAVIDAARSALTPAERRVADVVLTSPEAVAFGTVADLAQRAATSGATVVRLAAKLGYDGFTSMQSAVQDELGQRLRPAAERIREVTPSDVLGRVRAVELDNVAGTLEAASPGAFEEAVAALADESHPVHVLAGDVSRGIGMLFADELSMLRAGVSIWFGADVRLARHLAGVQRGDVLVAIDHRRYERWVLDTTRLARERGAGCWPCATAPCRRSPIWRGARSWCGPSPPARSTATSAPWPSPTRWWPERRPTASSRPPIGSTASKRRGASTARCFDE